jgi:hypothetical protein
VAIISYLLKVCDIVVWTYIAHRYTCLSSCNLNQHSSYIAQVVLRFGVPSLKPFPAAMKSWLMQASAVRTLHCRCYEPGHCLLKCMHLDITGRRGPCLY